MSSCSQNNLVLISTQNHKTKNPHGLPKGYISQRLLKDTQVHEGCSQTCSKMLNSVFGRKRIRQQLISHTHTHPPPMITNAFQLRTAHPASKHWRHGLLNLLLSQMFFSKAESNCSCSGHTHRKVVQAAAVAAAAPRHQQISVRVKLQT